MKKTALLSISIVILLSFNLLSYSQVKDNEGNTYKTIKIGNQTWMAENMKASKLNDGTPIKNITDDNAFIAAKTPAFAWYKNDAAMGAKYGALYNWHTVKTGKLCPQGWHVPSDAEWITLEKALGMSAEDADGLMDRGTDQGLKLKSYKEWQIENTFTPSGFAALPAGLRADDGSFMSANDGSFMSGNTATYFWTSTEFKDSKEPNAYYRSTAKNEKTITRLNCSQNRGHSVRCVKD
jgi:uncharacterized protein (TIGR02145 family)